MSLADLRLSLARSAKDVIGSDELALGLGAEAESVARYTAQHLGERDEIAAGLASAAGDVWHTLGSLWASLAASFNPKAGASSVGSSEDSRINLALALAKLERNLVAGLEEHQAKAVDHEPSVRQLIFNITTFARIEDARFFTLQAIITQLLVNLVSPMPLGESSQRASEKLGVYLGGNREDDVVIRLLDSKDVKANTALLHLLINLTRNSLSRQQQCLCESGTRWLGKILGQMDDWHNLTDGRFELSVQLINEFVESGRYSTLLTLLADDTEPLTPAQTTLLKLVDSHLSQTDRTNSTIPSPDAILIKLFKDYTQYSLVSFGSGQDDARLPKVFEGLLLVVEALSSIGLAVQARTDSSRAKGKAREADGGDEEVVKEMKGEGGIIKPLIDLLRALDKFVPRVKPGSKPTGATAALTPEQLAPFTALKRALVQLLGILTFEDTKTGDRVREAGGVELILSLTEVDETNPLLREHALLTVRNLMLNNPANQAIIHEMDPVGVVSETGEILPLPEKMRRKQREREEAAAAATVTPVEDPSNQTQ